MCAVSDHHHWQPQPRGQSVTTIGIHSHVRSQWPPSASTAMCAVSDHHRQPQSQSCIWWSLPPPCSCVYVAGLFQMNSLVILGFGWSLSYFSIMVPQSRGLRSGEFEGHSFFSLNPAQFTYRQFAYILFGIIQHNASTLGNGGKFGWNSIILSFSDIWKNCEVRILLFNSCIKFHSVICCTHYWNMYKRPVGYLWCSPCMFTYAAVQLNVVHPASSLPICTAWWHMCQQFAQNLWSSVLTIKLLCHRA